MGRGARGWIAGAVALAALAGGGAWLLLARLGNETGVEDFRANQPTLSAAEAGTTGPDSAAARLVNRWLERFSTGEYGWSTRLREYRVERMELLPAGDGRWAVSVRASLRPTRWSFGNWLAGSGGTVQDGWIHEKFLRFALTRSSGGYHLRELGPGAL
jgi:hypothetical protein